LGEISVFVLVQWVSPWISHSNSFQWDLEPIFFILLQDLIGGSWNPVSSRTFSENVEVIFGVLSKIARCIGQSVETYKTIIELFGSFLGCVCHFLCCGCVRIASSNWLVNYEEMVLVIPGKVTFVFFAVWFTSNIIRAEFSKSADQRTTSWSSLQPHDNRCVLFFVHCWIKNEEDR